MNEVRPTMPVTRVEYHKAAVPGVEKSHVNGASGGALRPLEAASAIQSIPKPQEGIIAAAKIKFMEPPSELPITNPSTGKAEPTYSLDEYTDPKRQAEIQAAKAVVNGGSRDPGIRLPPSGIDASANRPVTPGSSEAAKQAAANGGSTEAGITNPGTNTSETATLGVQTSKDTVAPKPPEALTQVQLTRQAELAKLESDKRITTAQQSELIDLNKQQGAFDQFQQQQAAQGKDVSEALDRGENATSDGRRFTQAQLDLAQKYRTEQAAQPQAVESSKSKPATFAERAKNVADNRSAFDKAIAGGKFAPDKSEATARPTDPILSVEQGRPLTPAEQTAYDTHMQGIEGKVAEGKPLTTQEAADYKGHLERQETQIDAETHTEAVELGKQINDELADKENGGQMTEATKGRMIRFIDTLTGGAYTDNQLLQKGLGLDLLDDKGKAQIAEKLQKISAKMTPEIAKRINERLQFLAQLEVQVYSLRAQRDENALSARNVKQFIKDNYANYDPQDDPSVTDQAAMEKRQKWIQALSLLNTYKAAIGAAEMAHVLLLQEAGQVRADLYKELGINKGERFLGMVVRKLGNWGQRRTTQDLIAGQYDEIEDKVIVSKAAEDNHKPPDLSGLKP